MAAPTRAHTCSHCARDVGEVELLFLSPLGACDIAICSTCIEQAHVVVEAHRADPARAAALIAGINAAVRNAQHSRATGSAA